jgi:two-component sensor histidine kinase
MTCWSTTNGKRFRSSNSFAQLAHFGDLMNNRIAVRGVDFWITTAAAQTIGMALHELATNAGK